MRLEFSSYQPGIAPMLFGPNDSMIKRGDREETGDNTAQPTGGAETVEDTEGGPDVPTDATAEYVSPFDVEDYGSTQTEDGNLDDLTIMDADDPTLGITNIGDKPAEDWAADTGPGRNPGEVPATTNDLTDRGSILRGKR